MSHELLKHARKMKAVSGKKRSYGCPEKVKNIVAKAIASRKAAEQNISDVDQTNTEFGKVLRHGKGFVFCRKRLLISHDLSEKSELIFAIAESGSPSSGEGEPVLEGPRAVFCSFKCRSRSSFSRFT